VGALPPPPTPKYTVNRAALDRWSRERLSLSTADDGRITAVFRYDGTTCTNLGRPLAFDYQVTLGPAASGYPIQSGRCAPAPFDDGHASMCRFLADGSALLTAIERETPLLGEPLDHVLSWSRPEAGPGCYCEPESRRHKWGLVLETIHYCLNERSKPPR
jgi:hypothetical protein